MIYQTTQKYLIYNRKLMAGVNLSGHVTLPITEPRNPTSLQGLLNSGEQGSLSCGPRYLPMSSVLPCKLQAVRKLPVVLPHMKSNPKATQTHKVLRGGTLCPPLMLNTLGSPWSPDAPLSKLNRYSLFSLQEHLSNPNWSLWQPKLQLLVASMKRQKDERE